MTVTFRVPSKAALRAAIREALRHVQIEAIEIIRLRTRRGVDADGAAFRPYTEGYRNAKVASGRDSGIVDLTLTGALLNNLQPMEIRGRQAWIGFRGTHRSVSLVARGGRAAFSSVRTGREISRRTTRTRVHSGPVREGERRRVVAVTPMAVIASALNRTRRFFAIDAATERRRLAETFRREFSRAATTAAK